jgi:hypothetical protein
VVKSGAIQSQESISRVNNASSVFTIPAIHNVNKWVAIRSIDGTLSGLQSAGETICRLTGRVLIDNRALNNKYAGVSQLPTHR